ncbi:uncharacterized protein TNCV_3000221 [Trichonephila clavipes]|nr:uncharacterized protein TNCV_3000221 [Trichonephila clavipes]
MSITRWQQRTKTEGPVGRGGWRETPEGLDRGEPREGVEGTEITRSGRRGPQAPQRLVIQNPHFSTTYGKRILNAAKLVYEDSIQNAAKEAICENEGNKNIAVAVDGTWQKRGYTSLNGVVTVTSIDTGKVIDVDILRNIALVKTCLSKRIVKGTTLDLSGAMEIQGASKIFQRSLSLHNARYITYLGDGDCKAFDAVKKENIYGNEYPIEKLECIGHVMKRMGTRLRRLKAQLKGQILSDAIRRNHSSVQNMRQAIWAIFLHKLSTDEYPQHGFCPIGEDSWCGFKRLKHQIETLSLGVYDAVCSFNDGNVSKLKMLQKMGVEPGEFSVSAMKLLDRERLMKAIYAFSGRSKKIRKDKEEKKKKKKIILRKISGNIEGTKDEEVTAEMDKGIMVADSFRSEQEGCAELALVWKQAKEGKGNLP